MQGSGVVQGATNTGRGHSETVPSGNGGSGDLSPEAVAALVELARVIDPEVCDGPDRSVPVAEAAEVWRRQDAALLTAKRLWDAGYRLVVDDDTTVERVARALAESLRWPWTANDAKVLTAAARAAVRALREDT